MQNEVGPPGVTFGVTGTLIIVKFDPLSEPIIAGFELVTRILYPVPPEVPEGIVAITVPWFTDDNVPMFTGLAKLPAEFES